MSLWLIVPVVLVGVLALTVGLGQLLRSRRRTDTPVSDQWRADHDYHRGGDGK